MRRIPLALLLPACALAIAGCGSAAQPPAAGTEFMLGLSMVRGDFVRIAGELGVRYVRPTLSWRAIEAAVQRTGIRLADVQDPAVVSQYIADHDWTPFDDRLTEIVQGGLVPFPIVGHGFTSTLPSVGGERATPDALGREEYLARQYLFVRAVVERYDGDGADDSPTGIRIDYWQTENELNQAFLTAVLGWRDPAFQEALGSAWADWDFVSTLMETLRRAVEDADPTALTTMNFHTDIHEGVNHFFRLPSWKEAIVEWRGHMDLVAIDAYPNYYTSDPPRGDVVRARVAEARARSGSKPVIVMETGYPTGPAERGFTEESQARYLEEALRGALEAGARGFFWFGSQTSDSHSVAITAEDLQQLETLAGAFERGEVLSLLGWLLANEDNVTGHFRDVLLSVEGYWGLVRPDDSRKPAYSVFRELVAEIR
jgi:hypothetical protein